MLRIKYNFFCQCKQLFTFCQVIESLMFFLNKLDSNIGKIKRSPEAVFTNLFVLVSVGGVYLLFIVG